MANYKITTKGIANYRIIPLSDMKQCFEYEFVNYPIRVQKHVESFE